MWARLPCSFHHHPLPGAASCTAPSRRPSSRPASQRAPSVRLSLETRPHTPRSCAPRLHPASTARSAAPHSAMARVGGQAARPAVASPQPLVPAADASMSDAAAEGEAAVAAQPSAPPPPPPPPPPQQQVAAPSAAAAPSTPRAGGSTSAIPSVRRSASSMSVSASGSAPGPSTPHSRAAAYGLLARASPPPAAATPSLTTTHTPRRPSLLFAPASLASSSSPTPSPRDATPPPPFLPPAQPQRGRGASAAAALASQHLGSASSAASNLFGFEVTALRPFGSPAPNMSTWRPPHAPTPGAASRLSSAAAHQPTAGSPRFSHLGSFNAAQAPASRPTSAPWPWSNTYGAPHVHAHQQQQHAPQNQQSWSALADPTALGGTSGGQMQGRFEENSVTVSVLPLHRSASRKTELRTLELVLHVAHLRSGAAT
jgi:hypothetical protein